MLKTTRDLDFSYHSSIKPLTKEDEEIKTEVEI